MRLKPGLGQEHPRPGRAAEGSAEPAADAGAAGKAAGGPGSRCWGARRGPAPR